MKLITCFCLQFVAIYGSPVDHRPRSVVEEINEFYQIEILRTEFYDDINVGGIFTPELSDLTYYLYTQSNRDDPYIIKNGDINQVKSSPFSPDRLTVFIVHGWLSSYTAEINKDITPAILDAYDMNVIAVDWHRIAHFGYLLAKGAVPKLGQYFGEFIQNIQSTYDLSGDKFLMIGHSIGAHIVGCAGATLNGSIGTIVGLDPAAPFYTSEHTRDRLDATDGKFVQIIHTSGSFLGYYDAMGHADYYPNGGESQPGCGLDFAGECSHIRSFRYYAESIRRNNTFYARKCRSYEAYEKHSCDNNTESPMGGIYVDKTARGNYYLETYSRSPYGKN